MNVVNLSKACREGRTKTEASEMWADVVSSSGCLVNTGNMD